MLEKREVLSFNVPTKFIKPIIQMLQTMSEIMDFEISEIETKPSKKNPKELMKFAGFCSGELNEDYKTLRDKMLDEKYAK